MCKYIWYEKKLTPHTLENRIIKFIITIQKRINLNPQVQIIVMDQVYLIKYKL